MNSNYPGGATKTGYGYGGAAGRPNMGRNMMMAAGGGMLLGMGGMYMFSRMNSYNRCKYGSTWSGSCKECYERYSREDCGMDIDENVNRDDLMNTGFWPDDFTGPLTVLVTAIRGVDLLASRICPPTGWTANSSGRRLEASVETSPASWTPPNGQDIFLTLTQMAELADKLGKDKEEEETVSGWQMFTSILSLLACCFCCAAFPAYLIMKSQRRNRELEMQQNGYGGGGPYGGMQMGGAQYGGGGGQFAGGYGGQPPQMGYGGQPPQMGYGGQQPQMGYGGQQYMGQCQQGPVVAGQVMGQPQGVVMGTVVQQGGQPIAQPMNAQFVPQAAAQGFVPGQRA